MTVTVHWLPDVESHPVQPVKVEPPSGVAVRVIESPVLYTAEQVSPQLIPLILLVTFPVSMPVFESVKELNDPD